LTGSVAGSYYSALSWRFVFCDGLLRQGTVRPGIFPPPAAADYGLMVTMPEVHRVGGLVGAELRGLDRWSADAAPFRPAGPV
jgi:hypothetical protein